MSEKTNWLVTVMEFVFDRFKTGNERFDKGLGMFIKMCIIAMIVMLLLSNLFDVMSYSLPAILAPFTDVIGMVLTWFVELLSDSSGTASVIHQLPSPVDVGSAVPELLVE